MKLIEEEVKVIRSSPVCTNRECNPLHPIDYSDAQKLEFVNETRHVDKGDDYDETTYVYHCPKCGQFKDFKEKFPRITYESIK